MNHKLGRKPRDYSRHAPMFERYVTGGGLPKPPAGVNYASRVLNWPMYGNDEWGDCEFARVGHMIQAWTAYAGTEVTVPAESVLAMYSAVTGFDPNAGPPGGNPTDNGADTQSVLEYWRTTGIKDANGKTHKIAGYAAFGDPTNQPLLKAALNVFGSVAVDINCPESAEQQFGQVWEYVPGSPDLGGHAICLQGVAAGGIGVNGYVTWGAFQAATMAFTRHQTADAWIVVSEDFIRANGTTVEGLDLGQLLADMADVC